MSKALYNWKILHYDGEQKGEWSESSSHLLTAWCFTTPGDSGESQSGPLIPTRRKQRGKKKKDPTTGEGGTAGHRLLSDCCVLKEGILYPNPRLLTYHQATFSNLLGFPSYSQLYIIIVADLLKESGSVCTRTPAQKIGSHWWVTFSTSQYILIQRGENSWSSGEKPWSALGQKRWGIECGPFPP